jgi:hypothetical protein
MKRALLFVKSYNVENYVLFQRDSGWFFGESMAIYHVLYGLNLNPSLDEMASPRAANYSYGHI